MIDQALVHSPSPMDETTTPHALLSQPYRAYFAVIFSLIVALFNGLVRFYQGSFSAKTFISPYINPFSSVSLSYKNVKIKFGRLEEVEF